ncbi:MAG: hypothetical protein GXX91_17050 [Verrucomicrobiaceae bacterium]|nr:hypothetical protein [Verrucomicrobiaceae bacterium]
MRSLAAIFVLVTMLPLPLRAAKVELPTWEEAAESESYYLGGGLWPKALIPDEAAAARDPGAANDVASADPAPGVAPDGTILPTAPGAITPDPEAPGAPRFYGPQGPADGTAAPPGTRPAVIENPDGTFILPQEIVEEEAYEPLPPIEGELSDLYFAHAPVDFLIDPQRLLTEQKSNDIKRFLEFHSDESDFRIFVMALGETQKIPDDIDIEALHKKWFSDSPTVLMLYYREQPQLTQLVFNESVHGSLPKSVFDRILQNTLREGGVTELAPDQVEKMAIELSIQLYWLSKLMEYENKEEQARAAKSGIHEMIASPDAPELLREYAPGIFIEDTSKILSLVFTLVIVVGGLALMGLIGWGILAWRGRENVSGQPLLFPEFQISPRLGGEFSGGGFVGMSFELSEGT